MKKRDEFVANLKDTVSRLVRKYSYSVRKCERKDLEQTVWFLLLLAKKKYNSQIGDFQGFAYYFADRKLKDHFWRRANLPSTKGAFTLLHMKANFANEGDFKCLEENRSFEFPQVLEMKAEGYSFLEIAEKLGISYSTVRRKWKRAALEFKSRS